MHCTQITINKGWGSVARALSYTQAHAPHLKSAYVKIVQPFDDFYERVKGAPLASVMDRKTEDEGRLIPPLVTCVESDHSDSFRICSQTLNPPSKRYPPQRKEAESGSQRASLLQAPKPSDHCGTLPRQSRLLAQMGLPAMAPSRRISIAK
jgi:hypothetical protein